MYESHFLRRHLWAWRNSALKTKAKPRYAKRTCSFLCSRSMSKLSFQNQRVAFCSSRCVPQIRLIGLPRWRKAQYAATYLVPTAVFLSFIHSSPLNFKCETSTIARAVFFFGFLRGSRDVMRIQLLPRWERELSGKTRSRVGEQRNTVERKRSKRV